MGYAARPMLSWQARIFIMHRLIEENGITAGFITMFIMMRNAMSGKRRRAGNQPEEYPRSMGGEFWRREWRRGIFNKRREMKTHEESFKRQ